MLPKRTDLNGVFEVFCIFHLNLDWIDWMSSFINTSVAPQRSGLSQVLIHQSSGPSWTPRVYYRGRSLKCFCHIYRQRQRFRGNMISCGVMDRTFLWRSCRLFILSRATREKTVKSLSAVSRLTHICLQPQFSISLFLIHKSFFLTFFFNFLKKKMALVVCTRRKQLHTLLIRCNHSRPTNIHNTDKDFNSSTLQQCSSLVFCSVCIISSDWMQKVLKSDPTSTHQILSFCGSTLESATNTKVSNVGGFSSLWLNLHTDRNVCTTIIKNYSVIQL